MGLYFFTLFCILAPVAYKNIIYICGSNSFLVDREKRGFIEAFRKKYGDENIMFCSLNKADTYKEHGNALSMNGLFAEHRLFVFSGGRERASKTSGFKETLTSLLPHISDTDFLLFSHIPKTESGLIDWLTKNASLREKNLSWKPSDWEPYVHGSSGLISAVLSYYKEQESHRDKGDENIFLGHSIAGSITNLAFLEEAGTEITKTLITEFSQGYDGAKIFDFIDAILAANPKQALALLEKIITGLDEKTFPIFYGGLVSNLRKSLYIIFLRDSGKNIAEITALLPKIHAFVIKKSYQARISGKILGKFFHSLIASSVAYKSGK